MYKYTPALISAKRTLKVEIGVQIAAQTNSNVSVGAFTYLRPGGNVSGTASFGRYCSIAPDVALGGSEHPTSWLSTHPFQYTKMKFVAMNDPDFTPMKAPATLPPCVIGHDVWIGGGAIVKRGLKVGNGAVIAAGAVVTKDVPSYAIVGGIPAKVIRYRFEPEIIEALNAIAWWRLSPSGLQGIDFSDVTLALSQLEKRVESGAAALIPAKHFVCTAKEPPKEVARALF